MLVVAGVAFFISGFSFPSWLVMYGVSGFLALSLEIVWFRLMAVMLKSTAFTFGTLLFVYLGGLGLGAAGAMLVVPRSRRPAHTFVALQAAIGLYAGLSLTLLLWTVGHSRTLRGLSEYFGSSDPMDVPRAIAAMRAIATGSGAVPWEFLFLYFGLPALLIGPPPVRS